MKSGKLKHLIHKKTIDWYSNNAEVFSKTRQEPIFEDLDILFQEIPKIDNLKILDYGCGNGNTVRYLEEKKVNYHYFGYEPSTLANLAAEEYSDRENVQFNSTLPNQKFDLIIVRAVLHHLITDYQVIKEIEKILEYVKDNGYIFITTWEISEERLLKKAVTLNNLQRLDNVSSYFGIDSKNLNREMDSRDVFLPWGNTGWRYYRKIEKHIDKYLTNLTSIAKGFIPQGKEGNNYFIFQKKSYISSVQSHFNELTFSDKRICEIILNWLNTTKDFTYVKFLKYFNKNIKDQIKLKHTPKKSFFLKLILENQEMFGDQLNHLKSIFLAKPIRSLSGVSNIMLMTAPLGCPFKCTYCPNDKNLPKSYIKNEPAVFRGVRHKWDPEEQIITRIKHLEVMGHNPTKIELIIAGGTWSAHPLNYQEDYIKKCYAAVNQGNSNQSLENLQVENETANRRVIGLTLETRPDYITEDELWRMRSYGCTRVEIGVQTTFDHIQEKTKRGHGKKEVFYATELLKDFGFKITYHMMPNLPGATLESDIKEYYNLFNINDYQPDQLKIYPCMVIENTELYEQWKRGEYQSYSENDLKYLLKEAIQHIPPYVRISRLIRDIPSTEIESGIITNNLRDIITKELEQEARPCKDTRTREVRDNFIGQPELKLRSYSASGGIEHFISYESEDEKLFSLLRLRFPKNYYLKSIKNYAIIREVHTYGQEIEIASSGKVQHQGFGKKMISFAEDLAKKAGFEYMVVISGAGVREYYKKLGYSLAETYMIKKL